MKRPHPATACLVVLATAAVAACSSGSSGTGLVNMQVSTRAPSLLSARAAGPRFSAAGADQVTIELGGDRIVLDQVELVLRKVKFEGVGTGACGGSESMDVEGQAEECGEFRAGPTLLDLPLGEGVVQTFSATVPAGSYDEVQLQIHRPTNNNEDADFLAQHPDFEDVSIRVSGTYQQAGGPAPVPFVYTTSLTAVVNVDFESPIEVSEGATLDVTLNVDLSGWFADRDAGRLVDPAQAVHGQPSESSVEQNIRQSFHVFEDENHDGAGD